MSTFAPLTPWVHFDSERWAFVCDRCGAVSPELPRPLKLTVAGDMAEAFTAAHRECKEVTP